MPWKEDIVYGGVVKENNLYITLTSEKDWSGKLYMGLARHKEIFSLPLDYPRINQFPEWFSIKYGEEYVVSINGKEHVGYTYETLKKGLSLSITAGSTIKVKVSKS